MKNRTTNEEKDGPVAAVVVVGDSGPLIKIAPDTALLVTQPAVFVTWQK